MFAVYLIFKSITVKEFYLKVAFPYNFWTVAQGTRDPFFWFFVTAKLIAEYGFVINLASIKFFF